MKLLKPEQKFNLMILNSAFMLGPALVLNDGLSEGYLKQLLDGSQETVVDKKIVLVDVRDVADVSIKMVRDG